VIPADRKWFARIGAGAVLVNALMEMDPRFPTVNKAQREVLMEVKEALEAQAPEGAHPDPFEHEQKATTAAASDGRNGHEADTQLAPPPDPATSE
jgi:hypothetical protein